MNLVRKDESELSPRDRTDEGTEAGKRLESLSPGRWAGVRKGRPQRADAELFQPETSREP